jgi:NAD(P)-dependent dehydrogenase (short-subunit alcohol dehydrogenase family)
MAQQNIALITGAGGGIGAGIAKTLAADGFTVICVDKDANKVEQISKSIPGSNWFALDVTKESEIVALRDSLAKSIGNPTHLINSAGIFFEHNLLTFTEEEFDLMMNVNVKGMFFMCKAFIPAMVAAGKGNVINIASTAGLRGGRNRPIYSASKGAVVMFTRSIAIDFGPKGVRANTVAPGLIDTPMASWLSDDKEALAKWEKTIPGQRIGTPDDIGKAVSYLASDASSFVFGETLVVDGGGMA